MPSNTEPTGLVKSPRHPLPKPLKIPFVPFLDSLFEKEKYSKIEINL